MKTPRYTDADHALADLLRLARGRSTNLFPRVQELLDAVLDRSTRLVLFLGAGCSMTVRLLDGPLGYAEYSGKSWIQFMSALIDEAAPGAREAFFSRFLPPGERNSTALDLNSLLVLSDKLQVASFITAWFNHLSLRDNAISNAVHIPDESGRRESRLYEGLMRLPFSDIVTTNYDTNLEWFLRQSTRAGHDRIFEIWDSESLTESFRAKPDIRIFYLHGKAGASKTLIFDRFDYARLASERDGLFDYVTHLLRGATILYVGFGLNDQSFNLIDDRLSYLDGSQRPLSFAFVNHAAEDEHRTWAGRNVRLIEFGEYGNLPEIIDHVNVIRDFINWAEPQRPRHILLNEDRTRGYLTQAMTDYAEGRYPRSLEQSRAALASSLFWQRQNGEDGARNLPQDRALHLCHIRLRLALSHYKLRFTDDSNAAVDGTSHYSLVVLNLEEAERINHAYSASNLSEWTPFTMSARLLRAKLAYNEGRYAHALSMYSDVITALEGLMCDPRALPTSVEPLIYCLRTAEVYYYAVCQQSRLHYQLLQTEPEDPRDYRTSQRKRLAAVAGNVDSLVSAVQMPAESDAYQRAELTYLTASLRRIADIARWTGGRNGVNVFHGAVPWRQECTKDRLEDLDEAIVLLKQMSGFDGREKTSEWLAQRYRYLARAFGLRWLVMQETGAHSGEALRQSYEILQHAFQSSRGPGAERELIVNLLESARLNVLALFGERRSGGRELSPLTISAGLYYLDEAFGEIFGRFKDHPGVHLAWFEALGSSLAAYYALGVSGLSSYVGPKPKNQNLKALLEMSVEQRGAKVVALYGLCGDCAGRIALFTRSYDEILGECKAWSIGDRPVHGDEVGDRRQQRRCRVAPVVLLDGRTSRLLDATGQGFMAEVRGASNLPPVFEVRTLDSKLLATATLLWKDEETDPSGPQKCGARVNSTGDDEWRIFIQTQGVPVG